MIRIISLFALVVLSTTPSESKLLSKEFPKIKGKDLFIRIFKQERQLEVWYQDQNEFKKFKTYEICTFSGNLGPKLKQGDMQAPEGIYGVTRRSLNPNSRFHLSMNVGYPNKYDRLKKRTGNFIMIHGDCVSAGCFAMTDRKITEIYTIVERALRHQEEIKIHIFPFRMNKILRFVFKNHKWSGFWDELFPIYDYFEKNKQVPLVEIKNKKYTLVKEEL